MTHKTYRQRRVVGLDIGATGIKAAQVLQTRDGWVVEKMHHHPLPAGVIFDGRIASGAGPRLSEALRETWSEARFATTKVVLGLASSSATFLREMSVEKVTLRDADRALPAVLAAKDAALSPGTAEVSWTVVENRETDRGPALDLLVYSARRDYLSDLSAPLREAGLKVVGGDLTALAILRATRTHDRPADQVDALIDVGESLTTILLHQGGVPRALTLDPDSAGRVATARVMSSLGLEESDAEQAASIKVAPSDQDGPVARGKYAYVGSLAEKVRGGLTSYLDKASMGSIAKVTLTGGGSKIDGLGYALHNALGTVPLDRANLADDITFGKDAEGEDFEISETEGDFLAAIGLGMAARL